MRRRLLYGGGQSDRNIGDVIYIDQRDGSTQLVSGDINGTELQKIQNSVRRYRAKNLGNDEVIVAEVTEDKSEFISNGQKLPKLYEGDYSYYGDSFVQITVPISFKCVEIEEDLFRLQWLADHKPNSSWKEVPTDKILFGTDFIYQGKYASSGEWGDKHVYNDWLDVIKTRGEGYSMMRYCFVTMFKVMAMCVSGSDYFDLYTPGSEFCGISRIAGPVQGLNQEVVESEIIPNGNTATLYATDVEGQPYNVEIPWTAGITGSAFTKLVLGKNLDVVVKQWGSYRLYRSYSFYGGTGTAPRRMYNNGGGGSQDTIFGCSYENEGTKSAYCHMMFSGKINYTDNIDYFLSLPNE